MLIGGQNCGAKFHSSTLLWLSDILHPPFGPTGCVVFVASLISLSTTNSPRRVPRSAVQNAADRLRRNSAVPPAMILAGINAYNLWNEHWEHWSHLPPLEERVEYPYQNIRTRNFPWGDGDKVSALESLPICLQLLLTHPKTLLYVANPDRPPPPSSRFLYVFRDSSSCPWH
jgi:Cytochrome c oxidase subunit VIa.